MLIAAGAALRPPSFNGAAPARARNVAASYRRIATSAMASTGPRPRGRGMPIGTGIPARPAASTGPRPRGRGMRCTCTGVAVLGIVCFNGAAPARARNDAHVIWPSDAALLGLQRGRARVGAECQGQRSADIRQSCFNGAAPARARNLDYQPQSAAPVAALQRGRARAGAECCRAWRTRQSCWRCFNGAAPAWARNSRMRLFHAPTL